jgi:twinkle protein
MNAPIEKGANFLDARIRSVGIVPGNIDLRAYEREDDDFSISVKPASAWVDEVNEMFKAGKEKVHPGPLWEKTLGRIEFRPKEVSVWAGINGHFKSTFTSQITLDLCKRV